MKSSHRSSVRLLTKQLTPLLDKAIHDKYNSSDSVNSSQLVDDLKGLPAYAEILSKAAPVVVYSWFAQLVRDRLHLAIVDSEGEPQQLSLQIPGWDGVKGLPGGICFEVPDGSITYMRRGDMKREHFQLADRLKTRQIAHDTKTRDALRAHDARLEPLRKKYGDLKERDLIARAMEDIADGPADRPHAGA